MARAGANHFPSTILRPGLTFFFFPGQYPRLDFILPRGLHGPKFSDQVPTQPIRKTLHIVCAKISKIWIGSTIFAKKCTYFKIAILLQLKF